MDMTKEEALSLGIKIMQDIKFEYDENDEIIIKYDEKKLYPSMNVWLVGFSYGKEDYGRNVGANLIINADTKLPKELLFRNGSITLGYDTEKDKYFVEKKRP